MSKEFKALIYEKETVWITREVFIEAENIQEVERLYKEDFTGLMEKVYDYGDADYMMETVETVITEPVDEPEIEELK